jgi:hypothetical protein
VTDQDHALARALAALEPLVLEGEFVLYGYERGTAPPTPAVLTAESFAVRIDDPFETTLILRATLAADLPPPAAEIRELRAIVLTGELPPGLTGFISTVAGALAERRIPIVPLGATTRDHLLVPAAHWPEALAILRGLRDAARTVLRAADEP